MNLRFTNSFALALAALFLCSCVGKPYYGRKVVERRGVLICGVHGIPVEEQHGFQYRGGVSGTPADEFAARRYPNTLQAGFSYSKLSDSFPHMRYTCSQCELAHGRLSKFPMWYKKLIGWPSESYRNHQLKRAAKRARQSGDPQSAGLPDGDGYISIVD